MAIIMIEVHIHHDHPNDCAVIFLLGTVNMAIIMIESHVHHAHHNDCALKILDNSKLGYHHECGSYLSWPS
jgi:hypothetical protein